MKIQHFFTTVLIIGFYVCFFTSCSGRRGEQNTTDSGNTQNFPYTLENADDKLFLPSEIEEISGLSYLEENKLLCIQDEQAVIYTIDMKEEKISSEQKFGKNGDYEGIELVGKHVYAVRSDGQVYKTPVNAIDESLTEVFKTSLSHKNDVEGLAYDAENKRLLLACKGISGLKNDIPGSRAIYAFDLTTHQLQDEPVFLIEIDQVNALLNRNDKKNAFRPSGIAVHPLTGQLYIIASVGKVLIVLNKNGSIDSIFPLTSSDFKQPEGICFAPNGDMFISNEGKGSRSTILRYNYANNE